MQRTDSYINAGAIISGTSLNRDLIPAFATELHRVNPQRFNTWKETGSRPGWLVDVVLRKNSELMPTPDHVWWHTPHADQVRDVLLQNLESIAPWGWRFGEGEAPNAWGWWLSKDVGGDPAEGGGTFRREPTCVECGANHISGKATARWDLEDQAWKITDLDGNFYCDSCHHECDQVEWEHADKGLGEDELAERYGEKGHPEHKIESWRMEAATGHTVQGYWSWVYDKLDN